MKTDIYAELHLWSKNFDSLIRVLQRTEALGICSRQLLKEHEAGLEEMRATLNVQVLEVILNRELHDCRGLDTLRSAAEWFRARNADHPTKH
jgi:hypothetical protein